MSDGVLFLHAFPVDHRMWDGLAEGPRAIAPDLPGFGGSAHAPGGVMTMAIAADRCLEAVAGLDRIVVCGLSMGGYVAFELWRRVPERIAGMLLANTRAVADPPEGAEARRALAARMRAEGNVLVDDPPPLLGNEAPETLRGRVRTWIAEQDPEAIAAASLGMADRPDSTADLGGITVPTAVVTSDRDTMIPAAVSAAMAEQIPGATLTVIEGVGHLSNLEAPAAFAAVLREVCETAGIAPPGP